MDLVFIAVGAAMFGLFAVYAVLYIAATVGVTVYMLVALLRPEDF